MTTQGTPVRVRLDDKRRATLPPALLAAAGVGPGVDLVARVEGPGRIVLEAPTSVLGRLQAAVRAGKAAQHATADADPQAGSGEADTLSLVGQLLAERATDTSLTRHHADLPHLDGRVADGRPRTGTVGGDGEAPVAAAPQP